MPWAEIPVIPALVVSVAALDLTIYLQHRYFHRNPALWRVHMVHHVDLDIDVTTGARFHPVEILLSMGIKMAVVALLGAPVSGVVVFEVLLNATSMFNHGRRRRARGVTVGELPALPLQRSPRKRLHPELGDVHAPSSPGARFLAAPRRFSRMARTSSSST